MPVQPVLSSHLLCPFWTLTRYWPQLVMIVSPPSLSLFPTSARCSCYTKMGWHCDYKFLLLLHSYICEQMWLLDFFKKKFILSVWLFCLHICLCNTWLSGVPRGQKMTSDLMEWELQMAVSHNVTDRDNIPVLWKTTLSSICWAKCPVPWWLVLIFNLMPSKVIWEESPWGIVWIGLTSMKFHEGFFLGFSEVGRPSLNVGSTISWSWPWNEWEESELITGIHPLLFLMMDVTWPAPTRPWCCSFLLWTVTRKCELK